MHYLYSTSYPFINAKISAIKSKMLTVDDYEALIALDTIDEMIDRLEKTYYRASIQKLSVYLKGSELVESSSYKWLVDIYRKIIRYMPPSDRKVVNIFLNRHEIRNLKLLISAKIRGKSWEEVEPLIFPISDITDYRMFFDTEFRTILRTVDIGRDLLSLRLSNLWKGKERTMNELIKRGRNDIFVLSSLELYYGYYLEKYLSPYAAIEPVKLLLLEQDVKNLSILLRFIEKEKSEEELLENLLYGGSLSIDKLIRAFKDEVYRNKIITNFGANPNDDVFKIEFDMYLNIAKKKRSFRYKVLTLDRILGFFVFAESEAERLRFLARAKEMGINKSTVAEMVL